MVRKPRSSEPKQIPIFNPEDVKQVVEISTKPKPKPQELETVEKIGKVEKKIHEPKEKHILIITEKPQAASKIAAALSNGEDKKIKTGKGVYYYEFERDGKKIVVACAVGHLFTLAETKKSSNYPTFDIEWVPNFKVKKKDFTKKYYDTIKRLVSKSSEIIIATDFDIEGEVIGYNILRFIANKNDGKRMKFSSLTAKELRESFENLRPTIEWGQAIAGETRHFLDWLYGINLSRALMKAISLAGRFKIMSIGRVQGPTLHLIVEKEKKIREFKPTPYWQVFLTITDGKNRLEVKHINDITEKKNLEKFEALKGKEAMAETKEIDQTLIPPPPFDLTTLQTEAYRVFSITPSQTLRIAQQLYLAGLISYPRTSSQKIPESMNPKEILEKLSGKFEEVSWCTRDKPVEGKKSDPAHPAIIPTGNFQKLNSEEKKIFDLIVKRFISCFCSDAKIKNKKVEVKAGDLKFIAKGIEILEPGWLRVYPLKMEEKEIETFKGKVLIEKVRIEEKETKPPKRYTSASLVKELEKRNLGTKATRAMIIDTLYSRNYIEGKSIKATELGMALIETLEKYSPIIIDEKLTREIEKEMERIKDSKKDLERKKEKVIEKAKKILLKISDDFKKNEKEIGEALVKANEMDWEKQKEDNKLGITCPECKKGELTLKFASKFKSYFVACSRYPECKKTYSLPSNSLIKKSDKVCENCKWPLLISIKANKKPWVFCFNPSCYSKKSPAPENLKEEI